MPSTDSHDETATGGNGLARCTIMPPLKAAIGIFNLPRGMRMLIEFS